MEMQYYGTGKRKSAIARVFLFPGKGSIRINRQTLGEYFKTEPDRQTVRLPLLTTDSMEKFDVYVNVQGGGHSGQAGAIRLGISRALLQYNNELRARLKRAGFLTRDPRVKERKKYGQKGARKRFQFSKR